MAILEVNNVKKIYTTRFGGNQVQALSNINFSVEKGEYVAIMGVHPLHPAAFPEKSDHPDAEDRQRVSVSPETQNSQGLTGPDRKSVV